MAKTRKKVTPRQAASARTMDRLEKELVAMWEYSRRLTLRVWAALEMVRRSERR